MSETQFSEEEVNRMLAEQRLTYRLDNLNDHVQDMTKQLVEFMHDGEASQEQVITRIAESNTERRKLETAISAKAEGRHEEYHKLFVKKADLKSYGFLILAAITGTVSVITYLGAQSTNNSQSASTEQVVKQVTELLKNIKEP